MNKLFIHLKIDVKIIDQYAPKWNKKWIIWKKINTKILFTISQKRWIKNILILPAESLARIYSAPSRPWMYNVVLRSVSDPGISGEDAGPKRRESALSRGASSGGGLSFPLLGTKGQADPIAKWSWRCWVKYTTLVLSRRSPGGFSGDSFSRQKESRPSRRATFGTSLLKKGFKLGAK